MYQQPLLEEDAQGRENAWLNPAAFDPGKWPVSIGPSI
jgi:hypothetical protein